MVSLLEGKLKTKIAAAFNGKLTRGTIRRETPTGVNSGGSPNNPTVTTAGFNGIRESFSAFYKAQANIPETDVSILILLGSTTIEPKQDDLVYLDKPWYKWHKVRRVLTVDPAQASMKVQAYEVAAPA